VSLQDQFFTFFMMVSSGCILGIGFEIYRLTAGLFKPGQWLVAILDIIYWCAATLFVFKMLYEGNQGELRFFVFLGLVMGVWFYIVFLRDLTIKVVLFSFRLIHSIIRTGIRTIDIMIIRPVIMLYKFIIILLGFLGALAMFLGRFVLQLFYPLWILARWCFLAIKKRVSWPKWLVDRIKQIKRIIKRFF
jgi:spore cortex biosynthesis protein YabQ